MKFEVSATSHAGSVERNGPEKRSAQDEAAAPTARFTLDQGPFAGQSFTVAFDICPNPCCPCAFLGLECHLENSDEPPRSISIDLRKSRLSADKGDEKAIALAQAFHDEAPPHQWRQLWDVFTATKCRQMDTMDLDSLDAVLPEGAKEGAMVAYSQVFPWAPFFEFTFENGPWFADEQYCVRPECDCTEAALSFFHRTKASGRLNAQLCVFYDYVTGKERLEKSRPKISVEGLLQSLHTAHPALSETLRRRHAQLKQLARRLRPQTRPMAVFANDPAAAVAPAMRVSAKVGRNDPCPCGSGKKYKRCCGME